MSNALPGNVEPALRGIHSLKLPSGLRRGKALTRTHFVKPNWPIVIARSTRPTCHCEERSRSW